MTSQGYIRTLSVIHKGLIIGPTLLGILFYAIAEKETLGYSLDDSPWIYVVPSTSFGGILLGELIFRKAIKDFPKTALLRHKVKRHHSASVIRYILIEIPIFLGVFVFMATNNLTFLVIVSIAVFYLILIKPKKENIEKSLNLNRLERLQFQRPNEFF
ncbi:hypothetical protein [Flagellimonas sp.]|uniref:hypothetical protein n=1 Tax=Flagellimonas sp. TaxID=2058762 RepID=UPI003F4A58B8